MKYDINIFICYIFICSNIVGCLNIFLFFLEHSFIFSIYYNQLMILKLIEPIMHIIMMGVLIYFMLKP